MSDEEPGGPGEPSQQVPGGDQAPPQPPGYPPTQYPPTQYPSPSYPPSQYPPPTPTPPNPYAPPGAYGQAPPYGYGTPGYPPPAAPYGYGYPPSGPLDPLGRPFASWWERVGALLIDGLVVWVPGAILLVVLGAFKSTTTVNSFTGARTTHLGSGFRLLSLVIVIAQLLYFAILDGQSQSVGKRAVGIAVRGETSGQPIGFGRALGRWLIYVVLWYLLVIPGLLNALSPLWDQRRQAWHDHAVGSLVVKLR
ncbi:MAG: RDD family protein [Acidimicrobiales bacterium]